MANEENLIPFTSNQSREEAEKNGRKGGQKSGEVRRQRKAMKEQMELLLSLPCKIQDNKGNDIAETLEFLGIDKENIDNQMLMTIALWKTAINSNSSQQINAVREIREIVKDEQTVDDDNRVQIINDLPDEVTNNETD